MILSLSYPRDPRPIPHPHDGPDLHPTPSIPPLYATILPPTSYKGKRLTSPIFQHSSLSLIPPSLKEEKKLVSIDPKPSKPLAKTKRNHCVREHQWIRRIKARELASQPISSSKTPNVDMIPFVQSSPNLRKGVQPKSPRSNMFKKDDGSC